MQAGGFFLRPDLADDLHESEVNSGLRLVRTDGHTARIGRHRGHPPAVGSMWEG